MHELKLMDVQKKYKDKEAVRKFNYTFTNGVYGLLGENGAGKTTLMRLICGVLQPTRGSIYCDNIEIDSMGAEYRRLLGYLPQDFGYYGDFTAERFLRYMAALKALPEDYADSRIDELLDMVELKNVKKKKLKTFSGGMIRRIGIAQALLNNPEILILDEPTAGLDPKERVRFRNVISSLGKNRMVLLSTHIVSDIDYIADRILIMKNGKRKELFGKGARAIINSAFLIGLMQYCYDNRLCHPGVIILDTPLTTFREKDAAKNEKDESVGKDIKMAVYEKLATACKDYQIIIFENEEPTKDLKSNINYIHFSGNANVDRKGFIPE